MPFFLKGQPSDLAAPSKNIAAADLIFHLICCRPDQIEHENAATGLL